jgi:hypothetical protein
MASDVPVTDQARPRRLRGFLALAAVAAVVVGLVSCGGDDEQQAGLSRPSTVAAPDPGGGDATSDGEPEIDPSQTPGTDPAPPPVVDEGGPLFALDLPTLDVQAPIVGVRMTDDLVLVPPRDPDVVGWWSQGAAPGDDVGTAVLVGHTVHSGGGALEDIDRLSQGDRVGVGDQEFRVTGVEVLGKDDLARRAGELFDQSASGRVVLITCEEWDGSAFLSNVVVTAVPA